MVGFGSQVVLVMIAVLLQLTGFINILGINLNLALIVLVPLIFVTRHWLAYPALILLAALLLTSAPGIDKVTLVFSLLLLASFIFSKIIPWQPFVMNFVFIVIITIIINLPHFFPLALIFNIVLGMTSYYLMRQIYA
jgi:hypothetical protein